MKLVILAAVAVFALGGCQSKPVEQMSYTELRAVAGQIQKRCEAQGVYKGSKDYDMCIRQEINRETSVRQANYNRINSGVVCNTFGTTVICN